MSTASPGRLALAGAVAGLSGVAASQVVTSVLNARVTPVQAVAEVIIAKTPGPVVESLIRVVGRNDKPILVAGVTIGVVVMGAVAGLLTDRRALYGHLVFWAMAVVGLIAAVTRPDFTPVSLLPLAVGVVVWTVLLDYLTKKAQPQPTMLASRRRFLLNAGGVTAAALLVTAGGRVIGRSRRSVESARRLLRPSLSRGARPPRGQGAQGPCGAPW